MTDVCINNSIVITNPPLRGAGVSWAGVGQALAASPGSVIARQQQAACRVSRRWWMLWEQSAGSPWASL